MRRNTLRYCALRLLICSSDFPMAEGFGPDVQLTRTQTIMQGASHCDFRYALKKREKES